MAFFLLLLSQPMFSQERGFINENQYAITAGISFAFGSTVNRIGLSAATYYVDNMGQLNASFHLFWNLRTYGPKEKSCELQAKLGALLGFGSSTTTSNLFLSPLSNQTKYNNSLGYAYSIYKDNHLSSQVTGMIGVQVGAVQLLHENDILAGKGRDRFRTGAISATYRKKELRYGLSYIGWTGDSKSKGVKKVADTDYPAKWGYKNLSEGTHGKFSHGILALQTDALFDYGQVARLQLGVDAEQLRHALQNKFMHETITGGSHYPMLKENGEPYLFQEGEKVRPVRLYYQALGNPTPFY
jgi:hypothetical protein